MNILVTGGSSGLGKAITELCALDNNNTVYFTYSKNLEGKEEIEQKYPNVKGIQLNFKDSDNVANFINQIPELNIDVLVNNAYAGMPQGTYFHKTEISDFLTSFQMNILPVIQITQVCILAFRKKKFGKIINVLTSSLIDLPPMGYSIYTANKAYIEQLSKCWCKENAKFNITSNCISPEYMQTSFAQVDERVIEQMQQEHPLKRLLQPQEVAEVVVSLINTSQQINGVNLPINAAQHIL